MKSGEGDGELGIELSSRCLKPGKVDVCVEVALAFSPEYGHGLEFFTVLVLQAVAPCPWRTKPICCPSTGTGNHTEGGDRGIGKKSLEFELGVKWPLSWPLHVHLAGLARESWSSFWQELSLPQHFLPHLTVCTILLGLLSLCYSVALRSSGSLVNLHPPGSLPMWLGALFHLPVPPTSKPHLLGPLELIVTHNKVPCILFVFKYSLQLSVLSTDPNPSTCPCLS